MIFLLIIGFDYPTRHHHGNTLRHVNYARELQALGHQVYFGVQFENDYREESRQWFIGLREQSVISDFFELAYSPTPRQLRLATLTFHPSLENRVLRTLQRDITRQVKEIIAKLNVRGVIISDGRFWFLANTLMPFEPIVLDIVDCVSLFMAREILHYIRCHQFWKATRLLRRFLYAVSKERYYVRRGNVAIVVSPSDQRALVRISGESSHVVALPNGVTIPPPQTEARKIRNRLIFSGNMDFSPNYDAAVWFLDHVFPRVLEQVPDAQFVLAGANPPPFLKNRSSASVVVTGYVEDLNAEIACSSLYVVPMVTGSGFKNKVVEAIVNRTYLVATPLAVEFLDPGTRRLIAVAESPQQMAETIVQLLRDPDSCSSQVSALYDHVTSSFTWAERARELVAIVSTGYKNANQSA